MLNTGLDSWTVQITVTSEKQNRSWCSSYELGRARRNRFEYQLRHGL